VTTPPRSLEPRRNVDTWTVDSAPEERRNP
jgi:hypothetical protein